MSTALWSSTPLTAVDAGNDLEHKFGNHAVTEMHASVKADKKKTFKQFFP
jgi:hypothetical protein